MKCSNCHVENIQSAIYCVHCGHKLTPPVQEQKPCSSCGAVNLPQAVFCVRCGNKIQDQTNTVQPQQKEEATPDTKLEEQVELEGLKSESAQETPSSKEDSSPVQQEPLTEDVLSSDKPQDAQPEVTLLSSVDETPQQNSPVLNPNIVDGICNIPQQNQAENVYFIENGEAVLPPFPDITTQDKTKSFSQSTVWKRLLSGLLGLILCATFFLPLVRPYYLEEAEKPASWSIELVQYAEKTFFYNNAYWLEDSISRIVNDSILPSAAKILWIEEMIMALIALIFSVLAFIFAFTKSKITRNSAILAISFMILSLILDILCEYFTAMQNNTTIIFGYIQYMLIFYISFFVTAIGLLVSRLLLRSKTEEPAETVE